VVSKTGEARVYTRRPRARHDVGTEPLDWVRIGMVLTFVLLASGGGLATAGLLRQGPLRDIGWSDRRLERFTVERPAPDSTYLGVGVAVPASSCTLQLTVDVVETPKEVLIGPVHGRQPRLPFTAPECQVDVERVNGRVYAVAELDRPIGTRKVLYARNRRAVEIVAPRTERSQAPVPPATDGTGSGAGAGTVPSQRPGGTATLMPGATVTPDATPSATASATAP
jgi:hypothetical protein